MNNLFSCTLTSNSRYFVSILQVVIDEDGNEQYYGGASLFADTVKGARNALTRYINSSSKCKVNCHHQHFNHLSNGYTSSNVPAAMIKTSSESWKRKLSVGHSTFERDGVKHIERYSVKSLPRQ
jgi:hypothetical protein